MCTLWSLKLAKKSCNNINNSCAQVSRLCYFLWLWTNAIHIFPNISRSKDNQIMKFGQVIECNIRNIFLEKSNTKYSGDYIPDHFRDHFLKSQNWAYLWINSPIETKLQTTSFYLIYSSFKKQKRSSTKQNCFFCYIMWPDFIVWLPSLREILGNLHNVIIC